MKTLMISVLAVALFAFAGQSASAMDSMHGSMMMHGMMMPKCAAGDSVVGVNTLTHKYMTHGQMQMKMAGMSDSKIHAMMMTKHVKMMCMSKAKAMGATMMKPSM